MAASSTVSIRLGVRGSVSHGGLDLPVLKLLKAESIESRRGSDRLTTRPILWQWRLACADHAAACGFTGLASLMVGGASWRMPWSAGFLTR
jgi:hypothetical protein